MVLILDLAQQLGWELWLSPAHTSLTATHQWNISPKMQ